MSTAGLTPFAKGDGRAAEAGRRGGIARATKRAAERDNAASVVANLRTLAAAAEREDLPSLCIGVAISVLGRVAAGSVPVRHGGDAAELVRALVDVARLASGAPAGISAVVHLSAADARARLAELAAVAGGLGAVVDGAGNGDPSSAAVAAEDELT